MNEAPFRGSAPPADDEPTIPFQRTPFSSMNGSTLRTPSGSGSEGLYTSTSATSDAPVNPPRNRSAHRARARVAAPAPPGPPAAPPRDKTPSAPPNDLDTTLQRRWRPLGATGPIHRLFRKIIGIREDVLAWAPEEYPRYTRLGAIVVNTGIMAAVSMEIALSKVVTLNWAVLIPIALFWGFLILTLDGWMVATTHGIQGRTKFLVFIPRLFMSVVIGFVIAEPLLMWVFQPSISGEIANERQVAMETFTSTLKSCNPVPPKPVDAATCTNHILSIPSNPQTLQQKLNDTTTQRDNLATTVNGLQNQLDKLESFAASECAGRSGSGLSGHVGEGGRCRYDRMVAEHFRKDSDIDALQAQLTKLNSDIHTITQELASANATYGDQVSTAIADEVRQFKASQGKVGLLDEERGLSALSHRNFFVYAAVWLVRILLVLIDCLPVLAKMLSGTTTYDRLITNQLDVSSRLHVRFLQVQESADNASSDVHERRTEQTRAAAMDKINDSGRRMRAREEENLDAEIEELAARLRGDRQASE